MASPFRLFLIAFLLPTVALGTAFGQSTWGYADVHDFNGGSNNSDGVNPGSKVTFDADGNAYGTTKYGGTKDLGMIWEITRVGSFRDLHDFGGTITDADGVTGPDGAVPNAGVVGDDRGNFYGATTEGGPNGLATGGDGMVWEINFLGQYVDVHDFGGTVTLANGSSGLDGKEPMGDLAVDSIGEVYGTTYAGALYSEGNVWLLSGGEYEDLHDFGGIITLSSGTSGTDGGYSYSGVAIDAAGDIFGQAYLGGGTNADGGMVWEIPSGGAYKDLHDYGNGVTGGDIGYGGVTVDSSGNLYGVASGGGPANGGTLWKIPSGGSYTVLHNFGGSITLANNSTGKDGTFPVGNVIVDSSNNLYGITSFGGPGPIGGGGGNVWEYTAAGLYLDLHDFDETTYFADGTTGTDAYQSNDGLAFDPSGNLYGTEFEGGEYGNGIIWKLISKPIVGISLNPTTIIGGYSSTATVSIGGQFMSNQTVTMNNQWPAYVTVPATVTVLAGHPSATLTASVPNLYSATFTDKITAVAGTSSQFATLTVTGEKLSSMSVSPTSMAGTGTSTGTVVITNAAPPGGWTVTLKSALPGYVSVPSTVTVPAGATSATFTLTGMGPRDASVTCNIYATDKASGVSSSINIQGDSVASLSLSPSTIGWSGTSTGTVTLASPAPTSGWAVNLTNGASGYLSMPTSVTVPVGSTSASFSITGVAQFGSTLSIRINANDALTGMSQLLTMVGDSISSVSLSPSSVAPGKGSTGTITLAGAAPAGGWKVNLTVGAPSLVGVPASVIVPAGATSVTFAVTTPIGATATSVSIIANDGTSQKQTTLTIT